VDRPPPPLEGADVAEIVSLWNVGSVTTTAVPDTGTVNQTVLLTTGRGRFVLRGYRHRERVPVDREHAVIAHVRARGLPAVAPLPLPGGDTILERAGRYYALFPWAAGRQVPRGALGRGEAAAMGAFLARLQQVLQSFPVDQVPIPRLSYASYAFTRRASLAKIDELEATVRAVAHVDSLAPTVLALLTGQRAHVEVLPDTAGIYFGPLALQVTHGDYQESNLFFGDTGPAQESAVSAIIDWDQTCLAPRAWEVIRTIEFAFGFEPTKCQQFLRGYRSEQPLPLEDLDVAAAAYDIKASHSLWVYEELYVQGNRRVARFLDGAKVFVPVAERWRQVRESCT